MTVPSLPAPDSINLFYTEGSSDKVYQLQLQAKDDGWVVNFQYGRRGSTLKADTKTPTPVDFVTARKAYDKLLQEKTKKGYTRDQSGSIFQELDLGERFTGIIPQLLNPVREEKQINALLENDDFIAQEKFDGQRRSISFDGTTVTGANRDGLRVALPEVLAQDVAQLETLMVLDGEIMGERYVAFDLLEYKGEDVRQKSVLERLKLLEKALERAQVIEVVKTAHTPEEKRDLAARVRARRGEGVVFKKKTAPYVSGRPASGGNQLKWKYIESATVRVSSVHKTKRSVALECVQDDQTIALGNCTVPVNYDMPKAGDIVEVEYLYMYQGGSLYQPQFKGPRTDKTAPDALTAFKIKADTFVDEDDVSVTPSAIEEKEASEEAPVKPRKKSSKV